MMNRRALFLSLLIAVFSPVNSLPADDLIDLPLNGALDGAVEGKAVKAEVVGDVPFAPGRDGEAARFDGKGTVKLAIGGRWPVREGCAELWIKPTFRGGDKNNYWLLCDNLTKFRLFKYTNGRLYFQIQCDDRGVNCAAPCTWLPDEWHHVAFTWRNFNSGADDGVMMLYCDGQLLATATGKFKISKVGEDLCIGRNPNGENGACALIGGVKVRSEAKIDYRPKPGEIMAHDPRDYALSALGASVKVSSEIKSFRGKAYLGASLIDGRESGEYWCTDFPNGAKAPHWVELDLGADRLIGRIMLYMVNRKDSLLQKFRIEGWVGGAWKPLADVANYGGSGEAQGPRAKYAQPFAVFLATLDPPITLRRLRLFVESPGVVRLHEIEVLPPLEAPKEEAVNLADAGPVYRFDFGSSSSPVEDGWVRVSEKTGYTAESGYGWRQADGLLGVDRLEGYPATRDLVAGVGDGKPARHTFAMKLANGRYAAAVVAGDMAEGVSPFRILAEGKAAAPRVGTADRGGWDVQTFAVDVTDGELDLTFEAEESWAIAAVLVAPIERFADVQTIVDGIEDRFARRSPALLKGFSEHRPDEPVGDLKATEERRARGYEVFSPSCVRQIFPTTVPNDNEATRAVRLAATPGEYEPVSIAVRTFKPLRDVRLRATDLRGPGVIPSDRIDIKVVRCWPQIEERWANAEYMIVPELIEPQGRHGELWLKADTTRQFWITVHVPDDAKPGAYEGALSVAADDAQPTEIKLSLDVLPFRLRGPKPMSLGIYYYPREETGDALVLADLRDMREHGLNAIAFTMGNAVVKKDDGVEFDLSHIRWVLGLLKQVGGFEGPFPLYTGDFGFHADMKPEKLEQMKEFIRVVEAERAKQGWPELLYYPVDEPFAGEKLEQAVPPYKACKEVPNIRTYCTVSGLAAETLGPWLDVRCHTLTASNGFFWPKVWESAVKDGDEFWWYSNATRHYFDAMRMKAGFFHWKVRATGQTYWHYRAPCGTAFCDFDGGSRDHIAVHPGLDGPLGTVQWECHREGLDDAKYAWTLELLIKQAEQSGAPADAIAKARKVLDELRAKVNVDMESYDAKHPYRRYAFHYFCEWKPEDFERERGRLSAAIIELRSAMK